MSEQFQLMWDDLMVEVKDKRKYSSAVREEQAARTRARILDAASELFLERGYARTTMKDIAAQADVARDTVHADLRQQGTRADRAHRPIAWCPTALSTNVTQRPEALAIRDEVDQRKQIELFAKFIAGISTELRPVFEILRTASAVEPEMAKVFEEMDQLPHEQHADVREVDRGPRATARQHPTSR